MFVRYLLCSVLVCGCSKQVQSGPPKERAPVELVDAFFQAVKAGDEAQLRELVREDYVQHSSLVGDGLGGLLDALPLLRGFEVTTHRVLVDGDRVMLHQTYRAPDQQPLVAMDVFRIEAGQLAEHWDAFQEEVPVSQTVSGRGMTDGPTEVEAGDSSSNRILVEEFVEVVLTQGHFDRLAEFVSTEQYDQHNPGVGDGLEGLGELAAGLQEAGLSFGYTASPLVVAQGNFVMVGSEGVFGPSEHPGFALFYDLWRVENGKIVEHWDVVPPAPEPAALPHSNGFF